jgi:hypothetical protein
MFRSNRSDFEQAVRIPDKRSGFGTKDDDLGQKITIWDKSSRIRMKDQDFGQKFKNPYERSGFRTKVQDSGQKIRIPDKRSQFRTKDQDSAFEVADSDRMSRMRAHYPPMCDISTFSMGVASARISARGVTSRGGSSLRFSNDVACRGAGPSFFTLMRGKGGVRPSFRGPRRRGSDLRFSY